MMSKEEINNFFTRYREVLTKLGYTIMEQDKFASFRVGHMVIYDNLRNEEEVREFRQELIKIWGLLGYTPEEIERDGHIRMLNMIIEGQPES